MTRNNKKINVLAIDDDQVQHLIYQVILSDIGIVSAAFNGYDALQKLKNSKVDIILLDLEMPVMSGIELLNALESQPAVRHKIIVLSSTMNPELKETLIKRYNIKNCLIKPTNKDTLITEILAHE